MKRFASFLNESALPSGFLEGSLWKDLVYHGSDNADITELRPDFGSEYGIYVSLNPRYARLYGQNLYRVAVNLQHPKYVLDKSQIAPRDFTKADCAALKSQGFDSIVVTPSDIQHATEIVLFDSEQTHIYSVNY